MKLDHSNISSTLQKAVTMILVVGMLSLPSISMFTSHIDGNKNFIELQDEKDNGEQEKLEENSKNEKKDIQADYAEYGSLDNLKSAKNYSLYEIKRDFILEIPIPPPDLAA